MKVLHLIDTSVLLHMRIKDRFNKRKVDNPLEDTRQFLNVNLFPTDGIFQCMRKYTLILKDFKNDDNTICWFFDRKSIRKEWDTEYKGNRKANFHIIEQAKVLEEWLTKANMNTFSLEGYEADDLIASVYLKYYNSYDRIIIHTVDSDLAYLVDEKCYIKNPNPKLEDITLDNYSFKIDKNWCVPYNTSILFKIFFGDVDNIPNTNIMKKSQFKSTVEYIQKIYNITNPKYMITTQFLDTYLKSFENYLPKEVFDRLMLNYKLVYPRLNPQVEINQREIDMKVMKQFLTYFKMKSICKSLNIPYEFKPEYNSYTAELYNKLRKRIENYYGEGLYTKLETIVNSDVIETPLNKVDQIEFE